MSPSGRDLPDADLAVSSLCKESVLHPVLDCTVVFLSHSDRKVQGASPPGDREQMPLAPHPINISSRSSWVSAPGNPNPWSNRVVVCFQ